MACIEKVQDIGKSVVETGLLEIREVEVGVARFDASVRTRRLPTSRTARLSAATRFSFGWRNGYLHEDTWSFSWIPAYNSLASVVKNQQVVRVGASHKLHHIAEQSLSWALRAGRWDLEDLASVVVGVLKGISQAQHFVAYPEIIDEPRDQEHPNSSVSFGGCGRRYSVGDSFCKAALELGNRQIAVATEGTCGPYTCHFWVYNLRLESRKISGI